MHVSNLSDFISDVTSNTITEPNEFGTIFQLGVQSLETLEELEIQYSQALVKLERETISQNIRSIHVQSDSHHILFACLLRFLYTLVPEVSITAKR